MTTAEFRVEGAGSYARIVRDKLPFATIEGDTVIVRSCLGADESLGTHMVWLWGQLMHGRRVLRTAAAGGAHLVFECAVSKGPVSLPANAAEPLHLLGAELRLLPR